MNKKNDMTERQTLQLIARYERWRTRGKVLVRLSFARRTRTLPLIFLIFAPPLSLARQDALAADTYRQAS